TALRRVPLGQLRRCVVASLEGDLVLAGLPVLLVEDVGDRLVHLCRLLPRPSDERQVRGDQMIGLTRAVVLHRGAGRRGQSCDPVASPSTAAALLASSSAPCRGEGEPSGGDEE